MRSFAAFNFLTIGFCFLYTTTIFTQELSDDGGVHQIDFSGSVDDFIIPSDVTYDRIEFFLDGGDGGKGSDCNIKGGKGAQVTAAFEIAPFGISLRPGGTIRFIVGEKGKNRTGNNVAGSAGGGGGTAILYKHPGASTDNVPSTNLADAGSDWVILAVAGGGGGAYQRRNSLGDCGSNSKKGQGGRTGTSGGGFGINPGGTNGNGGTGISGLGGAGGGYLTSGVSQSGLTHNNYGKRGRTNGGAGGFFNFNGVPTTLGAGGYGYGGGGAGQNLNESSGGGGGGYSGGASGLESNRQGFGGGSFVNSDDIAAFRTIQGDQHIGNPKSGYITYKFFSSNGLIARCKDVTVQLDASNTATFLPDEADDGSYTTDESIILDIYAFPASTPGAVAGFFNFDCTDQGDHEYVLVVVPSPGSIGYCSFNLTVEDHAPPIAQCKNIVVELDGFTENISPSSVDDGSFDACSSHVLTLNKQTFNCLNIGNNNVVLTVRDENDNTATCTATVTVTDIGSPQATCILFPLTVQLDDSGMQNISIDQFLLFDSDNCNVASRSLSQSSFDCSDLGENIVTATVTDQSGNTGTCTGSVTVETGGPTALCQDATIFVDDQGQASLQAAAVDGGSSQLCDQLSLSVSPTVFDCSQLGSQEVTLTVTAQNNNQSTCTAMVLVEDNTPPVALCKDLTLDVGSTGNQVINRSAFNDGSYDNCGSVTVLNNIPPIIFGCQNVGIRTINVTVSDGTLTSSCTATATVIDNTPPRAVCSFATVQLDVNGTGQIMADDVLILLLTDDECGIQSQMVNPSDFTCADIGTQQVVVTVTDPSDNSSTCSTTVTVEDNIPPVALCKDLTINLGSNGTATRYRGAFNDGSYDNCGSITVLNNLFPIVFDCNSIGTSIVTLSISDDNNLINSCTATATVVDDEPPIATCWPATVQLDGEGIGNLNPGQVLFISNDACGIQSRTVSPSEFDCDDIGIQSVVVTLMDNNGNTNTCSTSITVADNEAPVVSCQSATVQLDDSGNGLLDANQVHAGEDEACTIASFTLSQSEFDCSEIGAIEVTLTATDQSGNTGTCSATVTVVDETPPVAQCQDRTINVNAPVIITPGNPGPPVLIDDGSYDNCDNVSLGFTTEDGSPISILNGKLRFPCNYVGVNTVILTASDGNLSSTCSASLTVVDNQPPSIGCETDVVVQLDDTGTATLQIDDVLAYAGDRCGIQSTTLSQNQFGCDDVGSQSITVTVTDNSGNSTDCIAGVIIEDGSVLNAICVSETIELDETGHASISLNDIDNGSGNACGAAVSLSLSQMDFNCDDLGSNTVVLTATDNNGQVSTCSAIVVVEDQLAPTITCNEQVNLFTDPEVCGATHTVSFLEAIDNCEVTLLRYRYRRSNKFGHHYNSSPWSSWMDAPTLYLPLIGYWKIQWEASDESGNVAQCNYLVRIKDNEAPTPVCLNPTITFNGEAEIEVPGGQLWDENAQNDNCGLDTDFFDVPSVLISCDQVGSTIPVTVTVKDFGLLAGSCTANITVEGLPCGWQGDQINCSESAESGYDPTTATYILSAEDCYDPNYYSNSDAQSMIQQELCGDGEIIAHVSDIDGDAWAGVFMRESDDPGAKMLQLAVGNTGLAQRKLRTTTGGYAFNHLFQNQGKYWLRLTRSGNQFGAFLSIDGIQWDAVLMTNIPMTNCIQIGLFLGNTTPGSSATAWFDNVQIKPPPGGNALQTPNPPMTNTQYANEPTSQYPNTPTPDFTLYPNPTDGEIHIVLDDFMDQPIQIAVFNQQGQKVLSRELPKTHDHTERLRLYNLKDGLYFIQLRSKEHYISKKLSLIR